MPVFLRTGRLRSLLRVPPVTSRALAREIVAEVAAFESEIKLHEFEERMEFSPVVFADAQGRDRTGSLYEFCEPRHLTQYIAERVLESKETRDFRLAVEAGVGAQHEQIKSEFDHALECLHVAKGAADGFRADYESRGQEPPAPVFTRKEINQLELFAEQQTDREIFRHYDQIITGTERDVRVIEAQQEDRAKIEMQEQPRDERGVLERSAGGPGAAPQTHDAPGGPPEHTIDHQVTRGDAFERSAAVYEDVLIIPKEYDGPRGEANITTHQYAVLFVGGFTPDERVAKEKAAELTQLAKHISDQWADPQARIAVFNHLYAQVSLDEQGRVRSNADRPEALDRTLEGARELAAEMVLLEPQDSLSAAAEHELAELHELEGLSHENEHSQDENTVYAQMYEDAVSATR